MAYRFDNILEYWAVIYKPLSHKKEKKAKAKRFYRIKNLTTDNEFARNANTALSPCMLYSVLIDAETDGSSDRITYHHEIYFATKAESRSLAKTARQDDDLGADIHISMDGMVQDLLAYLHTLVHTKQYPLTGEPVAPTLLQRLRGLRLDKAQWASCPVKFNEWHLMGLSIEEIAPRYKCVNPEYYNIESNESTQPQPEVEPEPDNEPDNE